MIPHPFQLWYGHVNCCFDCKFMIFKMRKIHHDRVVKFLDKLWLILFRVGQTELKWQIWDFKPLDDQNDLSNIWLRKKKLFHEISHYFNVKKNTNFGIFGLKLVFWHRFGKIWYQEKGHYNVVFYSIYIRRVLVSI